MKKLIFFFLLILTGCNIFCQIVDKPKSEKTPKLRIQSKYTVMTGIILNNISLAYGVYSAYNFQEQAANIDNNHKAQLNYLNTNLALSTTLESQSIWTSDIALENDSYDKKLKVNRTKYEVNLILSSFFFFAGNLMIISGLKNMVVTPNGVGLVYNF